MPHTSKELRAAEMWVYCEITDLPEDLRQYYEPDDAGDIGRFCHPLVVEPWPLVSLMPIEERIAKKQAMLDERLEQRRFESALRLIERRWRSDILRGWDRSGLLGVGRKGDVRYWKLVGDVWTDTERPSGNSLWPELLSNSRSYPEAMMSRDERRVLTDMGSTVVAYRGVGAQTKKRAIRFVRAGYSWTVNHERAVWFAKRFLERDGKAFVAEAHIPRKAILAYFNGRKEHEILVRPNSVEATKIAQV